MLQVLQLMRLAPLVVRWMFHLFRDTLIQVNYLSLCEDLNKSQAQLICNWFNVAFGLKE